MRRDAPRSTQTYVAAAMAIPLALVVASSGFSQVRPSFGKIEAAVRKSFSRDSEREPDDLITQSNVVDALKAAKAVGWVPQHPDEIVRRALPDNDYLVQQMQTRHGRRFMRKVGSRPLMYDRLDRVSRVPGGRALVRDLPKLPDADRQADHLEEFLPKIGSGRRRQVKDFDKPTQRIYTVDQLVAALRQAYQESSRR